MSSPPREALSLRPLRLCVRQKPLNARVRLNLRKRLILCDLRASAPPREAKNARSP